MVARFKDRIDWLLFTQADYIPKPRLESELITEILSHHFPD